MPSVWDMIPQWGRTIKAGVQFEGNLGEILALGAEISPYIGLREKWENP